MRLRLPRQFRVAILAAILLALGVFAADRGAWALAAAAAALALGIGGAFVALVYLPSRIPRDAVLVFRLSGHLREFAVRSPIDQFMGRGFPTLHQLRLALEAARRDGSVSAVIVEIVGLQAGFATASEIHDMLAALRDCGKRVVAILAGDNVTMREYLVAAGAGEIVANPDTLLLMIGVVAGGVFLKGALERLHLQVQAVQYKEYKGAAETFTREAMSPQLRESMEAIVADWQSTIAEKIALSRRLKPEDARRLMGEGMIGAARAKDAGLVDRVGHLEDIEQELDPNDKGKRFIGLGRYLRHLEYRHALARDRIALVHGIGPVIAGEPPMAGEQLSGERVAEEIKRAARDRSVRAIVLRVNSPGGSAVGSELVWRATLEARRRGKPLVASMGDVAGSGGYYVAMAADAIVAEPATITGSIGVLFTWFNARELMKRIGVGLDFAKSDEFSDAFSGSRALTESELAQVDKTVSELYETFTRKVGQARKLDAERTEEVARGRVWSGTAARSRGLVDELGGLERAIEIAREKAGFGPDQRHELVTFAEVGLLSGLRLALMPARMGLGMEVAARALEVPVDWAPAMLRLLSATGPLLLCPFF